MRRYDNDIIPISFVEYGKTFTDEFGASEHYAHAATFDLWPQRSHYADMYRKFVLVIAQRKTILRECPSEGQPYRDEQYYSNALIPIDPKKQKTKWIFAELRIRNEGEHSANIRGARTFDHWRFNLLDFSDIQKNHSRGSRLFVPLTRQSSLFHPLESDPFPRSVSEPAPLFKLWPEPVNSFGELITFLENDGYDQSAQIDLTTEVLTYYIMERNIPPIEGVKLKVLERVRLCENACILLASETQDKKWPIVFAMNEIVRGADIVFREAIELRHSGEALPGLGKVRTSRGKDFLNLWKYINEALYAMLDYEHAKGFHSAHSYWQDKVLDSLFSKSLARGAYNIWPITKPTIAERLKSLSMWPDQDIERLSVEDREEYQDALLWLPEGELEDVNRWKLFRRLFGLNPDINNILARYSHYLQENRVHEQAFEVIISLMGQDETSAFRQLARIVMDPNVDIRQRVEILEQIPERCFSESMFSVSDLLNDEVAPEVNEWVIQKITSLTGLQAYQELVKKALQKSPLTVEERLDLLKLARMADGNLITLAFTVETYSNLWRQNAACAEALDVITDVFEPENPRKALEEVLYLTMRRDFEVDVGIRAKLFKEFTDTNQNLLTFLETYYDVHKSDNAYPHILEFLDVTQFAQSLIDYRTEIPYNLRRFGLNQLCLSRNLSLRDALRICSELLHFRDAIQKDILRTVAEVFCSGRQDDCLLDMLLIVLQPDFKVGIPIEVVDEEASAQPNSQESSDLDSKLRKPKQEPLHELIDPFSTSDHSTHISRSEMIKLFVLILATIITTAFLLIIITLVIYQ